MGKKTYVKAYEDYVEYEINTVMTNTTPLRMQHPPEPQTHS
jgi:hypothetical protein